MTILVTLAVAWTIVSALVVGLCIAARRGDDQHVVVPSEGPQSDVRVTRVTAREVRVAGEAMPAPRQRLTTAA